MKEWDTQTPPDDLNFTKFGFHPKEFDNVAPVIPRWLYNLQNKVHPLAEQVREFQKRQTVESLRGETAQWIADLDQKLSDANQIQEDKNIKLSQVDSSLQQ